MSTATMPRVLPTAADIPAEWVAGVREAAQLDGRAIRAGMGVNTIEVKSLHYNTWMPKMLPGGGTQFATAADRDAVLKLIQEGR